MHQQPAWFGVGDRIKLLLICCCGAHKALNLSFTVPRVFGLWKQVARFLKALLFLYTTRCRLWTELGNRKRSPICWAARLDGFFAMHKDEPSARRSRRASGLASIIWLIFTGGASYQKPLQHISLFLPIIIGPIDPCPNWVFLMVDLEETAVNCNNAVSRWARKIKTISTNKLPMTSIILPTQSLSVYLLYYRCICFVQSLIVDIET